MVNRMGHLQLLQYYGKYGSDTTTGVIELSLNDTQTAALDAPVQDMSMMFISQKQQIAQSPE